LKKLLSGNMAIALGAYTCGVTVGAGYPGTPSTEILEEFARYEGVYAEWAPNEKVAFEVCLGAALAGARAMATMKHVGVNVAADPLMTAVYTGINGGLLLISADDPSMHSSQNEQDNRLFARFAKMPILEPSDSQEAHDMVGLALEISETFDIPVMLRTTTRIAHSQSLVTIAKKKPVSLKTYVKNPAKWLMVPGFARLRRQSLKERMAKLKTYAENTPVNFISWKDREVGVITSGISFQYVQEALPSASVLKIGLTNPLPANLIREFAGGVKKLFVVEELEPYLEDFIRGLGLNVAGKEFFPAMNEFNSLVVKKGFAQAGIISRERDDSTEPPPEQPSLPGRPPVLCPGCPHRGVAFALNQLKLVATGDIGCYTLGGLPPLSGMDSCVCMGASIGMAHGYTKGAPELREKAVAVIGDSTFLHSGITGLLNIAYNNGTATVIIMDNGTTAMTGQQEHPATGKTLMGKPAAAVDLENLVKALGMRRVVIVDPLHLNELTEVIKEETAAAEPSVIIAKRPCVLRTKEKKPPVQVDKEKCTGCKRCLKLGCPAISVKDAAASIDPLYCVGCKLCVQICRSKALREGGNAGA